jgi:glycosyltransferase involved in cell wall biosynthesis
MHIVQIETFGRGGLAHYVHNLSTSLVGRGHDVTLITAHRYELEGRDRPEALRVERPIGRRTGGSERGSSVLTGSLVRKAEAASDARSTARLCRTLRPDVVHLHCTNPAAWLYTEWLHRLPAPLVYTAHVVTPHERVAFERTVYRRLFRLCDHVIAHSRVDRRRLLQEFGLGADRVSVVPHGEYGFFGDSGGADARQAVRREMGIGDEAPLALFFGYIREYKGLDVLLDAWPRVATELPEARLLIVGDPVRLPPARRRELEARAEAVGAAYRFEYVPFEEVSRFFAAADTLVMPYRRISQSGVLFVALSLGVPVIGTRVGALPEILRDGENALLVEPESPAELAHALATVLSDPRLRERLARAGLEVARDHSWPSIAERTETLYRSLAQPVSESA